MKTIKTFTQLETWRQGHDLVINIYYLTKKFPQEEQYGLSSQMRRAAVSITSNIAEGFGRKSYKEKARFYHIARGSLVELQNQLLISRDVGLLALLKFRDLAQKTKSVHKLLNGLIRSTNP